MSRHPAPKPNNTDRPKVNKPEVKTLSEEVKVAIITEAAREVIHRAPEVG